MTRMFVCITPFNNLLVSFSELFLDIFSASVDEHIQVAGAEVFHKLERSVKFLYILCDVVGFFIVTVFEGGSIILTKKYLLSNFT